MNIRIQKLNENAVIPVYTKEGDAGMDLTAINMESVDSGNFRYIEYDTGLAFEIPEGYVGLIFPRSSISTTGLTLANAVGVIDPNYRGSVRCRFKDTPHQTIYKVGERVAQLIIMQIPRVEFEQVDELSTTERQAGGFGSSGK